MSIFSWIDCNLNESNASIDYKNKTKVIKRSELSIQDDKKYTNSKIKSSEKSHHVKNKGNCRILDLNPEEREKIAKLIKELGKIELEKKEISNELNKVKVNFQSKIHGFETTQSALEQEKNRLINELNQKENQIKQLENINFSKNCENQPRTLNDDEFLLLPKTIDNNFIFAGPPKLSNSRRIHEEIRTSSRTTSVTNLSSSKKCLLEEQDQLKREKTWLEVVLKQQKYMGKLSRKLRKLEEKQHKLADLKQIDQDNIVDSEFEVISDRTLNSESNGEEIVQNKDLQQRICDESAGKENDNYNEINIIDEENEEDLIISALNNSTIVSVTTSIAATRGKLMKPTDTYQSCSTLTSSSPSNSLFKIIDYIDEADDENDGDGSHDISSNSSKHFPRGNQFDSYRSNSNCNDDADDILSDVFFNVK